MKRILLATCCAALGAGCASSAEIQRGAYEHLSKAQAYDAYGDHYHAAKERAAADKQFAKAQQRAWDEAHYF